MKRFKVILLLLFIPIALQAQAIGQVPFGARVFSTGFPDTEKYWGDCTGEHIFIVKLESGDEIRFVNGCLGEYDIVSPRFSVGSDYLRGG